MTTVQLEWVKDIAIVTIDRPERRNALASNDIVSLTDALTKATSNQKLTGLILTGNGAFCAGGDLAALQAISRTSSATPETYKLAHAMIRALLAVPAPTIAAVDGAAIGMGMDLALSCDSRLIGPSGWLRQGWARYGAIPATGGLLFLQEIAPAAIWLLLDGQPAIDGATAAQHGLGEQVLEGTALAMALGRAQRLGEIPLDALRAYVRLTRARIISQVEGQFGEYAKIQAELFNGAAFGSRITAARQGSAQSESTGPG